MYVGCEIGEVLDNEGECCPSDQLDVCGVCNGDGMSCLDCNGIPNGPTGPDACGVCFGDNSTCTGCDGVVLSGAVIDQCGLCLTPNDTLFDACVDCAGVVNGTAVLDVCGVCGGDNSTCTGMMKDNMGPIIAVVSVIAGGLLCCFLMVWAARRRSCNTPPGYKKMDDIAYDPMEATPVNTGSRVEWYANSQPTSRARVEFWGDSAESA